MTPNFHHDLQRSKQLVRQLVRQLNQLKRLRKYVKQWILTALLCQLCLLPVAVLAAGLTAQLNSHKVFANQPVVLTLSTTQIQAETPDLNALERNFYIQHMTQSMQTNVKNGQVSRHKSWQLQLMPKTTGQIRIPSLFSGNLSSDPLVLEVQPAQSNNQSNQPSSQSSQPSSQSNQQGSGQPNQQQSSNKSIIDIHISAEGNKHYLFQEIPIKLVIATNQRLGRAELLEPNIANAEFNQVGEDGMFNNVINGEEVTIITRHYVLRPQTAGTLKIDPFTLEGEIEAQTPQNHIGFNFNDFFANDPIQQLLQGQFLQPNEPFVKQSNSLTLNIIDNPNAQAGDWFLPAKQVEFAASWQPEPPNFTEGVSVTRRIRLIATGAKAEQLPEIEIPSVDGAKMYVDSDTTSEQWQDGTTVATRQLMLSIIPTRGGNITLPELSVKWLDTQDDSVKTARLPEQVITATPAANTQKEAPTNQSEPAGKSTKGAATDSKASNANHSSEAGYSKQMTWLTGLLMAMMGLVGLLLFAAVVYKARLHLVLQNWLATNRVWQKFNKQDVQGKQARITNLGDAIKQGDVSACYQILLSLKQQLTVEEANAANLHGSNKLNATTQDDRLARLNALLTRIETRRYGVGATSQNQQQPNQFDSQLLAAIKAFYKQQKLDKHSTNTLSSTHHNQEEGLAPLYKV